MPKNHIIAPLGNFDPYKYFNNYKSQNLQSLFLYALIIIPVMAFSDKNLGDNSLLFHLGIRLFCLLPYVVIYSLFKFKKLNNSVVDICGIIIFASFALGVSIAAYTTVGLISDYYFGIVLISFIQFLIVPLDLKKTLILELLLFTIYFPINIAGFDTESTLIIKQLSNYLPFSILKIAVSQRFHRQITDSFMTMELNRKLKEKEGAQIVLGELLHLLNNPLLISSSLIKRFKKKRDFEYEGDLDKALKANDRMKGILKEMAVIQQESTFDFSNEANLKKYFKELEEGTKDF